MRAVLITGADGHLGRAVANQVLADGLPPLRLWVHARDADTHRAKALALADLLRVPSCRLAGGDLADRDPFARIDPREIGAIVHAAAVTTFSVAQETARVVNVEGTRKVLDFARRCPNLRACLLMSTLYATGLREGEVAEAPIERPAAFANRYEWSKWSAERLAIEEYADLPWRVVRIGTVLAEDASGVVRQQNAIHNTLRLYFHGLLPMLAGRPGTRIYLTTAQFAARACTRLLDERHAHGFFHASEAWDEALGLGETLDLVHGAFLADPAFRMRRVPKPLFCELETFRMLVDGARRFSAAMDRSLSSVAPFAPQLCCDKRVLNARLRAALPDLLVPRARVLLPRVCERYRVDRWSGTASRKIAA